MNKKNNKIASILFVIMFLFTLIPFGKIYATEATGTSSSLSTLKIVTSRLDSGSLNELNIQVKNTNGNIVSFIGIANGEYEVSSSGFYKYGTTNSNGIINIQGLERGTYEVAYLEINKDLICLNNKQIFTINTDGTAINIDMSFDRNVGNIDIINKLDTGTSLSGSEFILKDNNRNNVNFSVYGDNYEYTPNGNPSLRTNDSGKIILKNIPAGKYYLEQSSISNMSGLFSGEINVEYNNTTYVESINSKDLGNLKITMKDVGGNLIKGAKFRLVLNKEALKFDINNNVYSYNPNGEHSVLGNTTGSNQIEIQNIPTGKYTIEQIAAPEGFIGNLSQEIQIEKKTHEISVEYSVINGTLVIRKTNADNIGIEGFKFNILNSTDTLYKFNKEDGIYKYSEKGEISELSTNEVGEIGIEDLPEGSIQIKEISAPVPYERNEETVVKEIELTKVNEYYSIAKETSPHLVMMSQNNKAINGMEYNILNDKNELLLTGIIEYNTKIELNSEIFKPGNYSIKLIIPDGYVKTTNEFKFVVGEDKFVKDNSFIINEIIIKGNMGEREDKKDVTGAKFGLFENDKAIYEAISSSNGTFEFNQIKPGKYVLKQISAVNSMPISNKTYEIIIDDKYENTDLVYSFKIEQGIAPMETDNNYIIYIILGIVGLLLILGIISILVIARKNKKKKELADELSKNNDSIITIDNTPEVPKNLFKAPVYREPIVKRNKPDNLFINPVKQDDINDDTVMFNVVDSDNIYTPDKNITLEDSNEELVSEDTFISEMTNDDVILEDDSEPIIEPDEDTIENHIVEANEEIIDEPIAEPVVEISEEEINEPIIEPVDEVVEESMVEPIVEVSEEPIEKNIDNTVEEPITESIEEIMKEPTIEDVAEIMDNHVKETPIDSIIEPVVESIDETKTNHIENGTLDNIVIIDKEEEKRREIAENIFASISKKPLSDNDIVEDSISSINEIE